MSKQEIPEGFFKCDKCGAIERKGDMRYVAGYEVCEYCYDGFSEDEKEEANY